MQALVGTSSGHRLAAPAPRRPRYRAASVRVSSGTDAGPSSDDDGREASAGAGDASSTKVDRVQAGSFSQTAAIDLLSKSADNPWSVNTYHSKRAAHRVNELGDIVGEDDAPENILQQPGWDDAGKLRFCVATVADELGVSREDVEEKMRQLFKLVPGIERRVGEVKTADIVRMVASLNDVVKAFTRLRQMLPTADLGKIVEGRPGILLEDLDALEVRIGNLRKATPKLNWDAILTDFPVLFSVRDPAGACEEIAGKFPTQDATQIIGRNPSILLSTQSGDDMISYDNGSLKQVRATVAGDGTSDGW